MGLMSKLVKAGVAKRIFDEARKPHNQRRIKAAVSRVTDRGSRPQAGPRR
jgi:hypothetical protein